MLRIITAATTLAVLVACDSEGIDRADTLDQPTTESGVSLDDTVIVGASGDTADSGGIASGSSSTDAGSSTSDGGQGISDDAGSSTSDGGQGISDDAGSSTSDGGQSIDDDAGSSTSDGSQGIDDDAGSSTSDGGQSIDDDAGSSTSDGGQSIDDDAGSNTPDGGQDASNDALADDATNDSADDSSQGETNTEAGEFTADTGAGNVLRVSSLAADSSLNICTTMSDQDNFSDTRVGDFILHNNAWRPFRAFPNYEWEQCIFTNDNGAVVGWSYDWGPGISGVNGALSASGDFYVRSYPELIYGVKDEFRTSAPPSVTGLPVMLSDMPTFRVNYSYDAAQFGTPRVVDASNNARFPNGTTISGERNVAVESFFYEADAAGNCSTGIVTRDGGSNHTYEIMIWIDAGAERLPAGPSEFVANLTIRDEAYKVYTKASDPRYIAFVAQNPQNTGEIYMNDFIDWARDNAHRVRERFGAQSNSVEIQDDWCMANILVGTEIFWGAGRMNIMDWTITQTN